jgi:hypothetical protein
MEEKVNLAEKLAVFEERWGVKIVGSMNDYMVQVVKGEYR